MSGREPLLLRLLRGLAEFGGRSGWTEAAAGAPRYTVRGHAPHLETPGELARAILA